MKDIEWALEPTGIFCFVLWFSFIFINKEAFALFLIA
jgi:hypothetical protein